jgi:hypothetical protein
MPVNNDDIINEVLEDWSELTLDLLKASVEKAGLELTKDLLNSLRVEVVKAAAGDLARANFYFQLHGRFKDMKTTYSHYSGLKGFPPVKEIEEFIKKTGLEQFKYIPGYKPGKVPAENVAIRRLAWGISKGIAKRKTVKAKKWYAKTFYKQITPLMEQLGNAARERTAAAVKEAMTKDTK